MTQAIAERKDQPDDWNTMKEKAAMLIKTGFLPQTIKTPEQVIAITLTGKELGIGMMEAIRGVNVIQGKPSVSPQLMLALAIRTGQMEKYSMDVINGEAVVTVTRKGWPTHKTTFGKKEADAMGLSGKDNYKKQATVMYKWRALAEALRFTFPDAVSGIYTFDEMGVEMTPEGDYAGATPSAAPAPISQPQEKKVEAVETTLVAEPVPPKQGVLTDAMRRKLFTFAKAAYGETYENGLKEYLRSQFNVESTSELDTVQYSQALDWLAEFAKFKNPNVDLR